MNARSIGGLRLSFACRIAVFLMTTLPAGSGTLFAGKLDPDGWSVTTNMDTEATGTLDHHLDTAAVSRPDMLDERLVFTIDMGKRYLVHRVFFTGPRGDLSGPKMREVALDLDFGAEQNASTLAATPERVTVYAGNTPDAMKRMGEAVVPDNPGIELSFDGDIRFQPIVARHVRLVAAESGVGYGWHVAEIELYGSADPAGFEARDAVLVEKNAPAPLRLAAVELSYYLTELTGARVPTADPSQAKDFSGTLYRIADLKHLAPTREVMERNQKAGLLPDAVNVEKHKREVVFKAWPYKNVVYSVWEFLRRQGVRWVYPGPHGDVVPSGRGVDLDLLPLRYTPSSPRRYASFAAGKMTGQAYRFWWRNGYDETWAHGERRALGGQEMPPPTHPPLPREKRPAAYEEGFEAASPHTLATAVPWRLVEKHPDWKGRYPDGTFVKGTTCCPTSPGVIDFVVEKALAISHHPESRMTIRLVPMDSCSWCLCERCQKLDGPPVWPAGRSKPTSSFSESYFYFIDEVAKRLYAKRPHLLIQALAYSRHYRPPEQIDTFPPNVRVQSLIYGARYLPMESPANAEARATWQAWRRKVEHLAYYDHFLLHPGRKGHQDAPTLPLPGIAAIVSRARFLNELDALWGEVEGDLGSLPYNPWNFYAYPRLLWDVSLSEEEVLQEFFPAYFAEAAEPMLAYYRVLENHLVKNDINCTGADPGVYTLPVVHTMGMHLARAEKAATSWLINERVEKIRHGYDELRRRLGLAGRDLSNLTSLPQMKPDGGEIILRPEQLWVRQGYVRPRNGIWLFEANGRLGAYVTYAESGDYEVTLTAQAKPHEDVYPILTLIAGQERSEPVTISSTEYRQYTFKTPVKAGIRLTALDYRNSAIGGARNVMIKDIRIAPVKR